MGEVTSPRQVRVWPKAAPILSLYHGKPSVRGLGQDGRGWEHWADSRSSAEDSSPT